MKKHQLLEYLKAPLKNYGRCFRYEFHAYYNSEHFEKNRGDLASIAGDFLPWREVPKYLAPGRVIDIYVYEKGPDGNLDHNVVVTLPS